MSFFIAIAILLEKDEYKNSKGFSCEAAGNAQHFHAGDCDKSDSGFYLFIQTMIKNFCSVETQMNRSGSHRNHENRKSHLSEGSPPQGLSEARRGKEVVWDFF
jgi:hypothetical protein